MPDFLVHTWSMLVDALASGLVRPALDWLPFGHLAGDPHDIAGGLLILGATLLARPQVPREPPPSHV